MESSILRSPSKKKGGGKKRAPAAAVAFEEEDEEGVGDPFALPVVRPTSDEGPPSPKKMQKRGAPRNNVSDARRLDKLRTERMARRAAYEEKLAHTEKVLQSELVRRVQSHPLFPFANQVNGGLGRAPKTTDPTKIMDTTQAAAIIADLIADMRMAYSLREQIEIEQEERLASGRGEFLENYRQTHEALAQKQLLLSALKAIKSSSTYATLTELLENGVRDNILHRRWDTWQIAISAQESILPSLDEEDVTRGRAAAIADATLQALQAPELNETTKLSTLLSEIPSSKQVQDRLERMLLPHASLREVLLRDNGDLTDERTLTVTMHMLNLLDPLMTSRRYGEHAMRRLAPPVVNLRLLFGVIIFPAVTASSEQWARVPDAKKRDVYIAQLKRLKYVLKHVWMEATKRGPKSASNIVEAVFPCLNLIEELSESEDDSTVEPAHSSSSRLFLAEELMGTFLEELAPFFVSTNYSHGEFWPAALLRIIYRACEEPLPSLAKKRRHLAAANPVRSPDEFNTYGNICNAINSALTEYFPGHLTLGTMADTVNANYQFSRDLYALDALTTSMSFSAKWIAPQLAPLANALEGANRWRAHSEALDLSDKFKTEGTALAAAIQTNHEAKTPSTLRSLQDGMMPEEARRYATYSETLARALGDTQAQVLDAIGVDERFSTLEEGLQEKVERLVSDAVLPGILHDSFQLAIAADDKRREEEEEADSIARQLTLITEENFASVDIRPYHQPPLYSACRDLKERFDDAYLHNESEAKELQLQDVELRKEGEQRGWLAPDGSVREPTALRKQKEEAELEKVIEQRISVSTADLQQSISARSDAIARGEGIALRSDMEISSNVIFAELSTGASRHWAAAVGDVYALQTSQTPGVLSTFAHVVAADINRNEVMNGARGNYLQNGVYIMNSKRRYDGMRTLLQFSASMI